jgi:hypothetical protein
MLIGCIARLLHHEIFLFNKDPVIIESISLFVIQASFKLAISSVASEASGTIGGFRGAKGAMAPQDAKKKFFQSIINHAILQLITIVYASSPMYLDID